MANSIVTVNVSTTIAPTPATLQKSGAIISQGGTTLGQGNYSLLTQLSSLTPLLVSSQVMTSIAWSTNVVTVTISGGHGYPVGAVFYIDVAGVVPTAYNGTWKATIASSTTFTYALNSNPGSETTLGTFINHSAAQLTQMATTFFAQGSSQAVYVLELGTGSVSTTIANLSSYLTANPNANYTPGALGYFYAYLVPREWDGVSQFLSLVASYENTTARTYFFTTTTLQNYSLYTTLMKCVFSFIESPSYGVWASNALTAASYSGGIVTATTTTAHGVAVGQYFTISGMTPTGYNGTFLALQGTTGSTLVYAPLTSLGVESVLGTLQASLYSNAGIGANEFSLAAPFWVALNYAPSTTNKVTPFAFSFLYGVTPFPTQGNNALLTTLKTANTNWVGTGAEGGISLAMLLWGTTEDGNPFNYWYSVDWVQINLDLDTANAIINGSNNPINPLYYNQPGIDTLQAVAAATMARGVIYGLVLGTVTQTQLDGPVLDANLTAGDYFDQTVVNAVPFVTYSIENPSDYAIGKYAGLAVIYMPQQGFTNVIYNVNVTQLIAQ